ncbi:hypothetical protein [Paenibacillus sp.]|jgi:acyl carrier protein|uniref:hypothetical protein n=1 Tax=Paenibacillus sp. TaxID=58172 RepID=UPI002819DFAF|nr:hypothetical protein [Paenibacillus sp.]MDR0267540.1 hypothetical protein [Paenibacillus sp.]
MKSEKFEEWFDVAFERAASSSSLTSDESKQASWKKVQTKIDLINRKRRRSRRMQLGSIVAASFIAGAVLFSPPGVTKAISPIVNTVVDFGNGMMGIVIKSGDVSPNVITPKTLEPDQFLDLNNEGEPLEESLDHSYTWDSVDNPKSIVDAQSQLSFLVPDINQLPSEYQLRSYTISDPSEVGNKFDKIALEFTNNKEQTVWITIVHLKTYQSMTSVVPTETEKLQVGTDSVFYSPGSYNQLLALRGNLTIQIGSDLPKEELIRVYESLLQIN